MTEIGRKYLVCADTESGNVWKEFLSPHQVGTQEHLNDAKKAVAFAGNLYAIHYIRPVKEGVSA